MSRIKRLARSLSDNWDEVAVRVRSSRRVVLFLDFDGTLVNIAPRPDQVRLALETRQVLGRLARHLRVTLVVISGRRRSELLHHIGVPGIRYVGLYGWERGSHSPLPRSAVVSIRAAREQLSILLPSFPGIWLEDKQFSLSVHLLAVPQRDQPRARRKLRSLVLPFQKTLRVIENIRDAEVVPRCITDKGTAVREFLTKPASRHVLPFYFGDDFSDESAFEAISEGISIRVGAPRPTRARYTIRGPAAVAAVLRKLEAALV